ncbi:hypothetical protein [Methylomonas sp. TEB]
MNRPTPTGGHGGPQSGAGAWWLPSMQHKRGSEALGGLVALPTMPYPVG